ncbi:MAG: ribosome biogenesis GTP-binding protein YihA/YsxC [Hyphomonadaceae bacterium]
MTEFTDEQIEAGRKLFAGPVAFVKGVVSLDGLPPGDRPEFAFAGRSNVGKSSLINALCNRKTLARASNTPGRTQEINFFDLGEGKFWMADLPGYGFAHAPKQNVDVWSRLNLDYLRSRSKLKRVFVLIDSRRGIGEIDLGVMKQLDSAAVQYQVVLTKTDKIKKSEVADVIAATVTALKKQPAAHPHVIATSSEKGAGIPELRAVINTLP